MKFLIIFMFLFIPSALSHPIDMKALAQIESSNNPEAYNKKSGAIGLYQITPIVLKQFNKAHGLLFDGVINEKEHFPEELFNPHLNRRVASYYLDLLSQRCDTVDEILIAWNWGLSNLRKYNYHKEKVAFLVDAEKFAKVNLPQETQDFLKKYHSLVNGVEK